MLKSWKNRAFQLIFLILLMTQISFHSVIAQEVPSTNTNNSSSPNIERTRTVPSIEDSQKATPIKESQVAPKARSSRAKSSRPKDPYEKYYDAIQKFDEELYGEKG